MSLSADDVRHAAELAHIAVAPDELDGLVAELSGILEHVGRIAELDLADVPPTRHALDVVNRLSDDIPRPSLPRAALLANAPEPGVDGFRVPPIGA